MIELSIATGIPPSVWADEGERSIITAIDVLQRQAEEAKQKKR